MGTPTVETNYPGERVRGEGWRSRRRREREGQGWEEEKGRCEAIPAEQTPLLTHPADLNSAPSLSSIHPFVLPSPSTNQAQMTPEKRRRRQATGALGGRLPVRCPSLRRVRLQEGPSCFFCRSALGAPPLSPPLLVAWREPASGSLRFPRGPAPFLRSRWGG